MHVISRRRLREFWSIHPPARRPLEAWYKLVRKAEWKSFHDVKAAFPHVDQYEGVVIFDVGGNKFRLIAAIHYNRKKVFVLRVLTHAEYSRGNWKNELL